MKDRSFPRPVVAAVLAVLLVVAVIVLTSGLGHSDRNVASDAQEASAAAQSDDDGQPEQTAGTQPDAVAPSTIAVAARPGVEVDPALAVSPAALGAVADYPDGVTVSADDTSRQKVEGQGPGSINATLTIFTITVDNRSSTKVDLDRVVVTAVYGAAPGRLADPSYDVDVQDLTGKLAPGRSSTARYAFDIPDAGLATVSLHVDLDGVHVPVVFTGAVSS